MKYALALLLVLVSPLAFAASTISIEGLMQFVLYIIIIGLVLWLLWWLVGYAALPEPFAKIARIILAVIAVFFLINLLRGLVDSPIISLR